MTTTQAPSLAREVREAAARLLDAAIAVDAEATRLTDREALEALIEAFADDVGREALALFEAAGLAELAALQPDHVREDADG